MAPDGTLWVVENALGFLASVSPGGHVSQHRLAGPALAPSLAPSHLAIASDGAVWFTCPNNIGRLTPDGKVTLFGQPGIVYGSPDAIIAGTGGSIWYGGGYDKGSALVHVSEALSVSRIAIPPVDLADVSGLAFGPDGSLWFTEQPSDGVGRGEVGYGDSKSRSKVWPLPAQAITVVRPIVRGPDSALWFGESNAIARITPHGTISSYRTAAMKDIVNLVSGPGNALWFTTLTDVGRITMSGVITLWPLPGAQELGALLYDPHHHGFLIADAKAAVLRWFPVPA